MTPPSGRTGVPGESWAPAAPHALNRRELAFSTDLGVLEVEQILEVLLSIRGRERDEVQRSVVGRLGQDMSRRRHAEGTYCLACCLTSLELSLGDVAERGDRDE